MEFVMMWSKGAGVCTITILRPPPQKKKQKNTNPVGVVSYARGHAHFLIMALSHGVVLVSEH